jgi:hypothetical protein
MYVLLTELLTERKMGGQEIVIRDKKIVDMSLNKI